MPQPKPQAEAPTQRQLNFERRVLPVVYLNQLNHMQRTAAAALGDGEPFVYFAILKPAPPTGPHVHLADRRGPVGVIQQATPVQSGWPVASLKWAISARFRPAAVVAWCNQEAERIAG